MFAKENVLALMAISGNMTIMGGMTYRKLKRYSSLRKPTGNRYNLYNHSTSANYSSAN